MIIIGIVLSVVAFAYLCWSLFTLAVHALPFFTAVTLGLAAYHTGSGPIGAIVIGAIAGSITLFVGQIAFTTLRSRFIRTAVGLLFALPAGVAGYHAALGLAHIAVPAEGWQVALAITGAVVVAATASIRLTLLIPPDAEHGAAAGLTSPRSLASQVRSGERAARRFNKACRTVLSRS
jgi:hypothetical protein